jgi:hypothetical protein
VAPALTAAARSIESIERSAEAADEPTIPVEALLLLSDVFGSGVGEVIVAVLVIEPLGAADDVFTDSVNRTVPSTCIVAAEQVMVPPDPTAGVLQVKVPSEASSETKVVPAGRESVTVAFDAASGPLLKTKIEYAMVSPADADSVPLLEITRSALCASADKAVKTAAQKARTAS